MVPGSYSTDFGTTWNNFTIETLSQSVDLTLLSEARLLSSNNTDNLIRFVPTANYNGTATITFRAWDEATGTDGNTADVSTTGGTTAFSSDPDTASITVNAVNDVPTITGLSSNFNADEDVLQTLDMSGVTLADVEDSELTVTILVNSGVVSSSDGDGTTDSVTVANSGTSSMTLTGQASDINTYLDTTTKIRFLSASNANGNVTMSVTPNDGSADGTASNATIAVAAVNDTPTFTGLGTTFVVTEDQATNLDLSNLALADVENDTVTLTLSTTAGSFTVAGGNGSKSTSGGSVNLDGTGTTSVTVQGAVADINDYLDTASNISYTTAADSTTSVTLTVGTQDTQTGQSDTATITVSGVSDNPVIGNLSADELSYIQDSGALAIDQGGDATLTDVDGDSLSGGSLTVGISSGDPSEDQLSVDGSNVTVSATTAGASVRVGATTIGTLGNAIAAGNNLVVNFNSNATTGLVQTLLRNITYENTDINDPTASTRTVTFSLIDGGGGSTAVAGLIAVAAVDQDATAAAGSTTSTIASTATSSAVNLWGFTLSDAGTNDGKAVSISSIVINTSGSLNPGQMSFTLTDSVNSTATSGVYDSNANTLTFTGNYTVANAGSNTFTLSALFSDNSGLTEGNSISFTLDADTDITTAQNGTRMASSSAVSSSGTSVTVTATQLVFTTQPAGSTSGFALSTQPVVQAQDAAGNLDSDFSDTVTLAEDSAGSLAGASTTASSGVATFSGVTYTASADNQAFTLTADDTSGGGEGDLPSVDANSVTSDVAATTLSFTTEPVPTSVNSEEATSFTTVPVISAVNAQGTVDTDFTNSIVLSATGGTGTALLSGTGDTDNSTATITLTPVSGVATFTGAAINYTATSNGENFNLAATATGVSQATSTQMTAVTFDTDGTVTAGTGVSEPVAVASTASDSSSAVAVLDFTITDGGTFDNKSLDVTAIVVHTSGTANAGNFTYLLNGNDASNVMGVYSSSANTVTFSGLSISVAHGANETYTVSVYHTDNTSLTDGQTLILSTDGDTDFTLDSTKTQLTNTDAITNGTGSTVAVTATQLVFTTAPTASVSGVSLTSQPVVQAQDAAGNLDTDYDGTITLTENGSGSLSNDTVAASGGIGTFTNTIYTATADGENFVLTADANDATGDPFPSVSTSSISSDVVATRLVFATEPAPLAVVSGTELELTTVPVLNAVDANGLVDTDYTSAVALAAANGAGTTTMSVTGDTDTSNETVTLAASSGVVSFTDMALTYTVAGNGNETFNLRATSGELSSATSSQFSANDAPTITDAPSSITVTEDVASDLDLSAMVLADTDADELTVTLAVASGTLASTDGNGTTSDVTIAGSGTASMTLAGTIDNLHTYLDTTTKVTFTTAANDDTSVAMTVTANDGTSDSTASNITLDITAVNDAPTISGTPNTSVNEDSLYTFTAVGADIEGSTLTYSVSGQPAWLSINANTGELSGIPTNANVGTSSSITVSVSDGELSASLDPFTITVINVNDAPVISGTPVTSINEDTAYSFTPSTVDVDGPSLSYSVQNLPVWASFSTFTGAITGTPENDDVGTYNSIVITVTDGALSDSLVAFNITVVNVNDAPVISGVPSTSVAQDAAYSFTPTAEDVDSSELSFSVENLPSWASFDATTGALSGTPTNDDVGSYEGIVITVSDGALSDSLNAFTITVTNVNDGPTISGTPGTTATEDQLYSFTPDANDPDGDELTFSIQEQPGWMAFDTSTGTLSGTPGDADVGLHENIVISVSDGTSNAVLDAFSIEVINVNDIPTLTGVPSELAMVEDVTSALLLSDVAVGDDDNEILIFSLAAASGIIDVLGGDGSSGELTVNGSGTSSVTLQALPATLNELLATTGTELAAITYTSALNDDTDDTLSISLSDNIADALTATVALPITPVNDAPVVEGEPSADVKVGQDYSFTPVASDVEGDDLTFSIENLPRWAALDSDTGALTGTPGSSDVGTFGGIVISVSDGTDSSSLAEFSIEVIANAAPEISGAPLTQVPVGEAYSFTPTASDDDGDTLTFSIENAPSWANFSVEDGSLTGTPAVADVGTTTGIVISVTDGIDTTSLAAFDINVCDVCDDVPPTISGIPATTVTEGDSYSFVPVAEDANGDTLTFSIENQPAWASFDTATGALTGTPGEVNVGVTTGIVISVSDGNSSVSLDAFSIEVLPLNDAPSISGVPGISVAQGVQYIFTPTASDPDGDQLRFSIANQPGWASFNPVTGTLRGKPKKDDVGTFAGITISVTDGVNAPVSLPSFSIEVLAANTAPVISGEPRTAVTQGNAYSFTPTAVDADGDTLTFSIENAPDWSAFDTATGTLSGTPGEGDVGTSEGIVISVSDGTDSSSLPAFSIEVTSSNSAPVATDSTETVAEDSSISIFVQASDADDDELSFSVVSGVANGQLSAIPGGFLYTPNQDFVGSDSFSFSANDGVEDSNTAMVSIAVTSVNDKPVAVDDSFSVDQVEGGIYTLDVLANDTDVDISTAGDSLTLQGVNANLGSATIVGNQIQYSPGNSFIGTVNLTYSVRDSARARDRASVSLTINGVAGIGAPLLTVPDSITVDATGLFTRVDLGVASAVDADGNPLPVSLVDSSNVFAPGRHTVFWQAEDRFGTTSTESQQVNVNPIISIGDSRVVSEGTQVNLPIILNGDAPSYPLTVNYTVSGTATGDGVDHSAANGSVTFGSGREQLVTFDVLVDSEVEVNETIVFTLDDSLNVGASDQSTITISEENIAPEIQLAVTQSGESRLTVAQDEGVVTITGTVTDQNPQDTVTLDWTPPAGVTDTDALDNAFSFDPASLAQGVYEFSLFASDDNDPVKSNIESVFIDVVDTLAILDDTVDSDGDLIPDSQEGYTDSDGDGIPDYLDAIDDCNVVPEQASTQTGFLIESDPGVCMRQGSTSALNPSDGLQVIFDEVGQRRVGRNDNGDEVVFVASDLPEDRGAANIGGVFDFVLYDLPEVGQSVQVVIPQVQPVPENAVYRKYKTAQQQWVDFVTDDFNAVSSAPGEPGVCPPPGGANWTPGLTEGHWCVQLLIQDGGPNDDDGLENGAIVDPGGVAVVLDNNTLPEPQGDTLLMQWNTTETIDVLANDIDADGDALTIVNVSASFGEAVINNGESITYTPDAGFVGEDTLVYAVSDGNNGTGSAEVLVTINGNRAPGAVDDAASTDDESAIEIDVLANDIDVDGDSLTITGASAETGSVSITDNNTLLYVPQEGFVGADTITYTVEDSFGSTATATVTVSVVLANTAPVAVDDSVITAFNTPVTIDVLANDTDGEGDPLVIVEATASSGSVEVNADNTITFTPDTGFSGQVTISYTISDGLLTSSATLTVTVSPEPIETVTVTNRSSGGGSMGIMLVALAFMLALWRRQARLIKGHRC